MRFDINLPSIDHLEVASDKNRLTEIFLTNYCKALSNAFRKNKDFHNEKYMRVESIGRLK